MKFALAHSYRFDSLFVAYLVGLLQTVSIFVIEIVNFIVILTSSNYLETVMNFMALAVIADFDDAFFSSLGEEDLKQIVG
jgi:Na+-transporting NADH:ubiquinone oxidoreductase subunit NqrB